MIDAENLGIGRAAIVRHGKRIAATFSRTTGRPSGIPNETNKQSKTNIKALSFSILMRPNHHMQQLKPPHASAMSQPFAVPQTLSYHCSRCSLSKVRTPRKNRCAGLFDRAHWSEMAASSCAINRRSSSECKTYRPVCGINPAWAA